MPKWFCQVVRPVLTALALFLCVNATARAATAEIDAFTARFLATLQSIKDIAEARMKGQTQSDEKARLQTLAGDLREVVRSDLMLQMDPDRFYAKTGGLHYSVVDAIKAAFASH
ncbi:MAG: hypothetical protein AB7G34_06885, partial [Hyphomicrobiales bacterium]